MGDQKNTLEYFHCFITILITIFSSSGSSSEGDFRTTTHATRLASATLLRRNFSACSKMVFFCLRDRSLVNELSFIVKFFGEILGVPEGLEVLFLISMTVF